IYPRFIRVPRIGTLTEACLRGTLINRTQGFSSCRGGWGGGEGDIEQKWGAGTKCWIGRGGGEVEMEKLRVIKNKNNNNNNNNKNKNNNNNNTNNNNNNNNSIDAVWLFS